MLTLFLLLGCLAASGSGCGPMVIAATGFAAPFAPRSAEPHAGDRLEELERGLRSQRPEERKRALKQLAALGSPAAWRLVFSALADLESSVGDEAQLCLARLPDAALAGELAGRAGLGQREPRVRRRAAEALGRVGFALDAALLLAAVDDREPEVAHLALWSIERLASQRRLTGDLERSGLLLERCARTHREALVRAAAVCARGALSAAAARSQGRESGAVRDEQQGAHVAQAQAGFVHWLSRCGEDRDARVRCAVAMTARHLPAGQALALTRALADDPQDAVRLALVETYEALACVQSLQALIDRLDRETMPRARAQVVGALQRLSGWKHRDDPRPWRDWLRTLPPDWRPTLLPPADAPQAAAGAAAQGAQARTSARASFVGLPLLSPRVCFAIDFSGSMWTPMPDGRVPKDLVDARLRATLEALTPDTQFNIVVFTNEVIPWKPKLVPAQPAHVREAIRDFERCQEHGRGNFFDAALFALDDPAVDTLITLTDGVPTGGFHSHLDLVIPLLLERNRFRRIAFDTVLVDAPPGSERRWRLLSENSGGRLVATEKAE